MLDNGDLKSHGNDEQTGNLQFIFMWPGHPDWQGDAVDISSTDRTKSPVPTTGHLIPPDRTSDATAPLINQREPKSARSRRKPETSFPVGQFIITDEMLAWVAEKDFGYLDLRMETELFKDHALANDRRVRDWVAAWRTWIRRAARYNPKPDPTTDRSHIPIESWR